MGKLVIVLELISGLFLGYVFHYLIVSRLQFPVIVDNTILSVLCVSLALGFTFSSQLRCIAVLMLPSLLRKQGRTILKTMIISLVIAGPIQNMADNAEQVVRIFMCGATLGLGLVKSRVDLMFQPFIQAIFSIRPGHHHINDAYRLIDNLIKPIAKEFVRRNKTENSQNTHENQSDATDAQMYQWNFMQNVEESCEDIISTATSNCERVFKNGFNDCLQKVNWMVGDLYCWPLKMKFICNIVFEFNLFGDCKSKNPVDPSLGHYYDRLLKLRHSFKNDSGKVKLTYKMKEINDDAFIYNTEEGINLVVTELKGKKSILLGVLRVIDALLIFLCIRVMFLSQEYHDNYLIKIDYDNAYITKYFRKIDDRRKESGKMYLLPFKKIEEKDILADYSLRCKKPEYKVIVFQLMRFLFEMMFATIFVLMDLIFYECLDTIKKHGYFQIEEHGHNNITFEIKGTGFVSKIFRSMIKNFNISKEIKVTRNSTECLPMASSLDRTFLYKIYFGYLMILVLIIIDVYVSRLRRTVCAYFYPKREKKRIIYFYNNALRNRQKLIHQMKDSIEELATIYELRQQHSLSLLLRDKYPRLFGWLRIFNASKKCLLCGYSKLTSNCAKKQSDISIYSCPMCHFIYCTGCWREMGKYCYACQTIGSLRDARET